LERTTNRKVSSPMRIEIPLLLLFAFGCPVYEGWEEDTNSKASGRRKEMRQDKKKLL